MAPTLLSLMGISADYPMLGKDLTRMPADWPGRAIMQYDKNFALMRGKDVVILQPERARKASSTRMRPKRSPRAAAGAMKDAALGLVLWGSLAYQQGLYRTAQDSRLALN
jgi:phosphoglycerol transferase MdoB-like AlkP superfamily enzyme